ncbi:ABC transporter permease [Paenibacillus agri]|uniref:ABC transporter permease subunit n=1 Tax=Paenibacillus agri TaxID=2744309 RepID=A0A850EL73_9BACL|nr:ABC transporter permease subunit [Paenibacillus agri]NUU61156.1 ABC transporter permease subunit [Paenibacillus agri]
MRNTWIVYQKEMLETARTYKLIWIPVVFILLGAMQPIITYYMPEILQAANNVPQGILEGYVMPGAGTVMSQALGQYSTIGILVLVLVAMNSLSGERYNGSAELVLSKPVSPAGFVIAKWAGLFTILFLALGLGVASALYYTEQLIGSLPWMDVVAAAALYGIWLLCALSLTLLFSAFLRAPAAAFLSLLSSAGMALADSLMPSWFQWTPAALPGLSARLLSEGREAVGVNLSPCLSAALLILFCVAGASTLMGRNKLPK